MEIVKGIKYRVNGHEDSNLFANGILVLTNVKSSRKNVVLDIKTFENSNDVDVTVYADSGYDMKSFIRAWLGEVEREEEIEIVSLDGNDIFPNVSNKIEDMTNNYFDNVGNDFVIIYDNDW